MHERSFLHQAIVSGLASLVVVGFAFGDEPIDFSLEVQPIFAEHCLQCHGPDANKREAELRLDLQSSAESVLARVTPEDSELILRITSTDDDLRMPPGEHDALSPEQIDLLREWVRQGANYEQHWAFRRTEEVKAPDVAASTPENNPDTTTDIDRFVIRKLAERGLQLSSPATKSWLIRRATFDLTGLPPTWQEVTDFLADTSPQAFEKVVDRLLESNAYGERWGRHWLDLARYADTHGGAAIGFRKFAFSYTYRDYVIDAFNRNLPYDEFVTQQLAADQLSLAKNDMQLAALGFLTVGMQFRNPHNVIDDQIDVVTRGLQGLTVSCARCHDHKFDAITTKDYYSLYATFASSQKPDELPVVGNPIPTPAYSNYQSELQRLKISYTDMAREQSVIMRGRVRMQVGLYLREIASRAAKPDLVSADVLSYRTDDLRPHVLHGWQQYLAEMPADDAVFGPWVQLAQLDDASFSARFPELISTWESENGELPNDLHKLSAKAPRWNPRVLATLRQKQPANLLDVADAYGELFADVHREWLKTQLETALEAVPGETPVPDEDPKHLVANSPVNRQLRRHLYAPDSPTNVEHRLASRLLNRPINDNVSGRRNAIHNLNLSSPGSPTRAMTLTESTEPQAFHVFQRGNPQQLGDPVFPRFLSALGGSDAKNFLAGQRRLDLARAIVDPDNPLTRRVIVNWVWQHHFGKGLVRTPDDFGTRGTPPTHPELLDHLATKFLEDGWSLKQLHRRIMLSRVYQQASDERPAARTSDPENSLLWRMPRQRLSLEAMRDAMLWASGELDRNMGGRPFDLLSKPVVPRRSVYALVNRDIVSPLRSTFDSANPNACTAKRPLTTVPQQTLFALNSDFIQDRAKALATLVTTQHPTSDADADAKIVRALYRRTFSRDPDAKELATALAFVRSETTPATPATPATRAARWQQLAHALLASNEFVFLD